MTPPLWKKSEEELKNHLMNVKEESKKAGLMPNIPKTKIMEIQSLYFMTNIWETLKAVKLYFLGLQNHCRW